MITTASGASDPATRRALSTRSLEMVEGARVIAEALQDGGKLAVGLARTIVVGRHGVERLAIARRRLLQAAGLPQLEGGLGGHDGVARSSKRMPAGSLAAPAGWNPARSSTRTDAGLAHSVSAAMTVTPDCTNAQLARPRTISVA